MEQRLSLVTLGVADLTRSRAFYEALGWTTGAEPDDDVVFFQAGGMIVALWGRTELAGDSGVQDEGGWGGVFVMLGFLSLSLGVFNLLPIPVLDCGAIFLLFIEAVLSWVGIKLSMTMRERIQQVGFVMLLLLMGFVITNDLLKKAANMRGSGQDKPAATAPQK